MIPSFTSVEGFFRPLSTARAFDIPADIWMNLQTQHDLDTANIAERDNQRETIAVTIPVRDRSLLQELVRKFGWACVFWVFQIAATNETQELQASRSQNATLNKRRPIGFIQPEDEEDT